MCHRLCLPLLLVLCVGSSLPAQVPSGPNDWPQWRGPNRDGISHDKGLLTAWPEGGPKVLWQVDRVGVGYSSVVVKDGRIFTQGDLNGVEHILCLSAQDGSLLWAVQPEPVAKELAERINAEFTNLDKNQDGTVDEVEALARLGNEFNKYDTAADGDAEAIAETRRKRLFASLDANNDGKLSFEESGDALRDEFARIDQNDADADATALAASRATALFAQLDTDKDGKISRDESRRSALDRPFNQADDRDPSTNKGDQLLTKQELETYLAKRETGKDGTLSPEEVLEYYVKSHPGKDGILTRDELQGYFGGYRNRQGDGPRGTPTVDGDLVYCEGGNGDVTCLEAATGKTVWHVNLTRDFGGGRPGWGYSESPLIEGEMLVVTPGGKNGTVLALNKKTGDAIWQSSDIQDGAHYSSPVAATIGGRREIVQFARSSVFGLDAASGKFLWKYSAANNGTANCFTPIVDKNYVFVSSAYGTGSGLAEVSNSADGQTAEEVYFLGKLASHHGGAVKIGDYLYSNGGGSLMCIHYLTGDIAWQARSVGKGSLVAADGMLYVQSERYAFALVEATPEEYREKGRFKFDSHGRPSWAHPVVCGGRLYVRDQESLTAYDLRSP